MTKRTAPPADSPAGLLELALGPRQDPPESLQAIRDLRTRLDEREQDMAAEMRGSGSTWAEIGEVWAISRQAAQQRFTTAQIYDNLDAALGREARP